MKKIKTKNKTERTIKAWAVVGNDRRLHTYWNDTQKCAIYPSKETAENALESLGELEVVPCVIKLLT